VLVCVFRCPCTSTLIFPLSTVCYFLQRRIRELNLNLVSKDTGRQPVTDEPLARRTSVVARSNRGKALEIEAALTRLNYLQHLPAKKKLRRMDSVGIRKLMVAEKKPDSAQSVCYYCCCLLLLLLLLQKYIHVTVSVSVILTLHMNSFLCISLSLPTCAFKCG